MSQKYKQTTRYGKKTPHRSRRTRDASKAHPTKANVNLGSLSSASKRRTSGCLGTSNTSPAMFQILKASTHGASFTKEITDTPYSDTGSDYEFEDYHERFMKFFQPYEIRYDPPNVNTSNKQQPPF